MGHVAIFLSSIAIELQIYKHPLGTLQSCIHTDKKYLSRKMYLRVQFIVFLFRRTSLAILEIHYCMHGHLVDR